MMKLIALGRFVLGVFAGGAILAGCAVSQIPIQTFPTTNHGMSRRASWMAHDAADKNLLYASDYSDVLVFDYETNTQVGDLEDFSRASGSCTDVLGDVFITNFGAADILEFAHGGTKPVKTLLDPSPYPIDCSVDPKSGDLAVINEYGQSEYSPGSVAIYPGAKGKPKTYKAAAISTYISGTYDDRGDLLVSGDDSSTLSFAMLYIGSKGFKTVTLPHSSNWRGPGNVRWDGEYFDVEYEVPYSENPTVFMWYTIKGANGTQEGYTETDNTEEPMGPFWLGKIGGPKSVKRANQLVAEVANEGTLLFWNYPEGGLYVFIMRYVANGEGVTVSSAQRH